MVFITGAQAVHNLGVFELDTGNHTFVGSSCPNTGVCVGANATDEAATGDDWDNVCFTKTADALCGTSTGASATASAWTSDKTIGSTGGVFSVDPNATIFTGGGAKDPQDTTQWAWKDGAGGLPDKDNLQHAFAARYANVSSADCTGTETSCDVLYFGSDRLDNSGDAQQGFWFLQNPTGTSYDSNGDGTPDTACPQKIGGGTGFCNPTSPTGVAVGHADGDLLVISDFSNGGTNSFITIYQWCTGSASSTGTCAGQTLGLHFLGGSDTVSAECGIGATDDPFCGIVNLTDGTPARWPYTDKSGNHSYLKGELFEAGIDLTNLGLSGECFSSVLSESRASTVPTATLKDFVVGSFAQCNAGITTSPTLSGGTPATSVSPGTPVHDVATIVGNTTGKIPGVSASGGPYSSDGSAPANKVKFYLCADTANPPTITSCSSTTTSVGLGTLSEFNNTGNTSTPTSTANSPDVNTIGTPLPPGKYCFYATWAGDKNYTTALPTAGTAETGECFTVTVISTSVTTHQFYYPNDSATVSAASGTLPAGNVTFKLFGPTTGGDTAAANCAANSNTVVSPGGAGGLLYSSGNVAVTSGSPTVSSNNTSIKVPTDTGTLYWRVSYVVSPANSAFSDSSSTCVENNVYTHNAGAPDTATFNNDPNLP
jgi:hypothetical protein